MSPQPNRGSQKTEDGQVGHRVGVLGSVIRECYHTRVSMRRFRFLGSSPRGFQAERAAQRYISGIE